VPSNEPADGAGAELTEPSVAAEPGQGPVARRKGEHLAITAREDVESHAGAGWPDVHLLHEALPRVDLDEVDLSVEFLGRRLRAPLIISAMTGGHPAAREINARLGRAAHRHGLAMGVGSQRAALHSPELADTYRIAREVAPGTLLIANLGAAQLVPQASGEPLRPEQVREAVTMIGADALAIHLNFLEEVVQTEGDRRVRGLREALAGVVAAAPVPVIAKETGAGLSRRAATELAGLGFRALDVGGLGGTSFAAVEALRARARGDRRGDRLGRVYRDWGIPTAVSVVAAAGTGLPVIATGGVRSGLDAARALALGARMVGVARPLLAAALEGEEALDAWIERFLEELRVAVFLTGGTRVADLRATPKVITGETRRWLDDLGYSG
jgi:isopentenyl-diphosphate delta-isomerase